MTTLEELREELAEKQEELENYELDPDDYEGYFCDMLDECHDNLFGLLPSDVLRKCDPIQYSCGLCDYVDSLDVSDDPGYQALLEDIEELKNDILDLEESEDE